MSAVLVGAVREAREGGTLGRGPGGGGSPDGSNVMTPAGVDHYVSPRGKCVTCGRDHLGSHGRAVARQVRHERDFPQPTPYPASCDIRQVYGGYPHACDAQDAAPDAIVSVCESHGVWWVATEYDFR